MEAQQQIQQLSARLEEINTRISPKHWQAMEEKLSAYLLDELDQKLQVHQENSMDELLELRLSVLLNKKMQSIEGYIKKLHAEVHKLKEQVNDKQLKVDVEQQDATAHERYRMSERVSRHLEQLIEENAQFAIKIQQIRQLSVWIASAAGASLLISLMHYAFS